MVKSGEMVYPGILNSTQPNESPHPEKMTPYIAEKDEGILVGVDEDNKMWIIDGHNRTAAAWLEKKLVKVGQVIVVSSAEMWSLLD